MPEWPRYTIGELIENGAIQIHKDGNHGANYPRADDFGDQGLPFLTAKSLSEWQIDIENAPRLSEGKAASFRFGFIEQGDVLLSHNATVGRVGIVPSLKGRAVIGTSLTQFRLDRSKILPEFLAIYFSSRDFQNQLSFVMAQTTRNQVPITAQRRLPVAVPDLATQSIISETVFSFIRKMELNRRMNETLEAMARAIFRDWFVDFGPTRAKQEGREPYLAPEIWSLFPDRLDADGKPEGWNSKRVEDVLELAYGKALTAGERSEGDVPVYGSGGITGYHNKALQEGPAIVVGRKGTVGSLYWEDRSIFPIDTVFYVRSKVPLTFCFYLLQTLGLESMNTDAAVPGLNRNNVYRLTFAWGADRLVNKFDISVTALRQKMRANVEESRTLAALRDLLLPKLMSGEVRVK